MTTTANITALLDEVRALDASMTTGSGTRWHDGDGAARARYLLPTLADAVERLRAESDHYQTEMREAQQHRLELQVAVERLQAERGALTDCGAYHATACGGCVVGMHHMMSAASKAEHERDEALQVVRDNFPAVVSDIRRQREETIARAERAEARVAALMPVIDERLHASHVGVPVGVRCVPHCAACAIDTARAKLAALKETAK